MKSWSFFSIIAKNEQILDHQLKLLTRSEKCLCVIITRMKVRNVSKNFEEAKTPIFERLKSLRIGVGEKNIEFSLFTEVASTNFGTYAHLQFLDSLFPEDPFCTFKRFRA